MLDLGPRGRMAFLALFFGGEAVLIGTATMRTDRSYGFRMFPESSSLVLHVERRLADGKLVPIADGRWNARDCQGNPRSFMWARMVREPAPSRLDKSVGAPYGVDNEVQRAADALRWVSDHTPDDCETRALVATIQVKKNGRPQPEVSLEVTRGR
jgi:hypothetical protein